MDAKKLREFLGEKVRAWAAVRKITVDAGQRQYAEGAMLSYMAVQDWLETEGSPKCSRRAKKDAGVVADRRRRCGLPEEK